MNALQASPPLRPGRRTHWLLAGAILWLAVSGAATETITVGGTGAAMGTMRMLAGEFARSQSAHSVVVIPNLGSSGGVKALAAGALDLAAIARPLKPDEAGYGLISMPYGKTPLVIATNTSAAGTFANLAELADIYSGRRATWSEGTPIRLVMRSATTSDTLSLQALSPELKHAVAAALARPGMIIAATDQEAADFIERSPGAIGTITLALVRAEKRNVHILPINGVVPSTRTLADGSYPYAKQMLLARRKSHESAAVARFLEFVASPQGRRILAETGHWVADSPAGR